MIKEGMGEKKGGFREGREYVIELFTMRMTGEKLREKIKVVYVCFMDLEKNYASVCRRK